MSLELTGKYVSSTYLNLVQHASDNNYYDGAGNLLLISDASSLKTVLVDYIADTSLNHSHFMWNMGYLEYFHYDVLDGGDNWITPTSYEVTGGTW